MSTSYFGVPHDVIREFIGRGAKWVGWNEHKVHIHFFSNHRHEIGYVTPGINDQPFWINREWSPEFYDDLHVELINRALVGEESQ